jgi:hypothetical protein
MHPLWGARPIAKAICSTKASYLAWRELRGVDASTAASCLAFCCTLCWSASGRGGSTPITEW